MCGVANLTHRDATRYQITVWTIVCIREGGFDGPKALVMYTINMRRLNQMAHSGAPSGFQRSATSVVPILMVV